MKPGPSTSPAAPVVPRVEKAPPRAADGARRPWRAPLVVLALSLLPGCGHHYRGRAWRGLAWSLVFLGLYLPALLLIYIVWSYAGAVRVVVAAALAAFYLASAWGPLRSALAAGGAARRRPVSVPALGTHAAAVLLAAALELVLFRWHCFRDVRVETARLEPFAAAGVEVTVIVSPYVHPVHEEIVLVEWEKPDAGRAASPAFPLPRPALLARVLAVSGDSVSSRGGRLLVNGLSLDLRRTDQRQELERRGRAEKNLRLLFPLPVLAGGAPPHIGFDAGAGAAPGSSLVRGWGGPDWGPMVVPRRSYLLLLDSPLSGGAPPEPPRALWLVESRQIHGRAVF